MSWRDDPKIIWQDPSGDRLACTDDMYVPVVIHGDTYAPGTPAYQDEMLHRLAAVLGRRIVGIEAAPEPIAVGDLVTCASYIEPDLEWEVAGLRHGHAWLCDPQFPDDLDAYEVAPAIDLRPAAVDNPVEWVYTRDPAEIADAIDAGRTVQYKYGGRWRTTLAGGDHVRRRKRPMADEYRYEGPTITVDPDPACGGRCLPLSTGDWCNAPDPADNVVCSLPKGHDGDHVACYRPDDDHDLAVWGGDTR